MKKINKKILNYIERELRKEKSFTMDYVPTLAETEYLATKNITVKKTTIMRQGFMVDWKYPVDTFEYSRIEGV